MHRSPLTRIAPDIFRKRLLIEGYYRVDVTAERLRNYFDHLTGDLGLQTYGDPIIHRTSGQGQEINQGFDAFVPLVASGIYIAVWVNARFLSTIVYTCADFDEDQATVLIRDFFDLDEFEAALF